MTARGLLYKESSHRTLSPQRPTDSQEKDIAPDIQRDYTAIYVNYGQLVGLYNLGCAFASYCKRGWRPSDSCAIFKIKTREIICDMGTKSTFITSKYTLCITTLGKTIQCAVAWKIYNR